MELFVNSRQRVAENRHSPKLKAAKRFGYHFFPGGMRRTFSGFLRK
jgi:hypothetical protein